jgi:hypothetical protein
MAITCLPIAEDTVAHLSLALHAMLVQGSIAELPPAEAALLLPAGASIEPLPGGQHSLGTGCGADANLTLMGARLQAKLLAVIQAAEGLPGGLEGHRLGLAGVSHCGPA